jgi:hypothetical protein
MTRSLTDELWHLGALVEIPRDMHCTHGATDRDGVVQPGPGPCPECRQLAEVLEALRSERPS